MSSAAGSRKLAALVRLAGAEAPALLGVLGEAAPTAAELAAVDEVTEREVLDEVLALGARAMRVADPVGQASAAASPRGSVATPADATTSSPTPEDSSDPFELVSPAQFARSLADEHPQVVALVLAATRPKRAAAILAVLDPELKVAALRRLAHLEGVPGGPLSRAVTALRRKLLSASVEHVEPLSGLRLAASVLKEMGRAPATALLATLAEHEPELSEAVGRSLYSFEDLGRLLPADVRKLAPKIDRRVLALALRVAPEDIKALFMTALSSGVRALIEEEWELSGSPRLSEVAAAQQEIVQLALKMDEDGEIRFVAEEAA